MWVLLGGALALPGRFFFFFFFMPGSVRAKCEEKVSQSNLCRGGQSHPPGGEILLKVAGFLPHLRPLLTFYQRGRVGEHVSRLASGEYQTPRERQREKARRYFTSFASLCER